MNLSVLEFVTSMATIPPLTDEQWTKNESSSGNLDCSLFHLITKHSAYCQAAISNAAPYWDCSIWWWLLLSHTSRILFSELFWWCGAMPVALSFCDLCCSNVNSSSFLGSVLQHEISIILPHYLVLLHLLPFTRYFTHGSCAHILVIICSINDSLLHGLYCSYPDGELFSNYPSGEFSIAVWRSNDILYYVLQWIS